MANRPKLYKALSLIFVLYTPILIMYMTAYLSLPLSWSFNILKLTMTSPHNIYYWLIPAMISFSFIYMRKYSFFIFVLASFTALVTPIFNTSMLISELHNESKFIMYLMQVACVFNLFYFISKNNYKIFFNHAMRSWEWAKRYKIAFNFSIRQKNVSHIIDAKTYNISTSGLLFKREDQESFTVGTKVQAEFTFRDVELSIPIKIVRETIKDGQTFYGASFNHRGLWQYFLLKKLIMEIAQNMKNMPKESRIPLSSAHTLTAIATGSQRSHVNNLKEVKSKQSKKQKFKEIFKKVA